MDDYINELVNPSLAVEHILLDEDDDEEFDDNSPTETKNQPVASTNVSTSADKKRKERSTTSDVWDSFTNLGVGPDGKIRSKCKGCGKEYVAGGSKNGTSTLMRHIPKCRELLRYHDLGKMMLDQTGKLRARQVDQLVMREMIAMAIVEHDLPFSFVEYRRVRELLKYLNLDAKKVSRNTAAQDVWKLYLSEKEKLKNLFAKLPSRICLTSDLWTSCTTEGYITLTVHFVDDKWKLNSKIISFCHMPPPHTGHQLSNKLLELLTEWGIEKKIFSLTLDNASANDCMKDLLKQNLNISDGLLCKGEFFHVRCAHILNLIVQDGLKVASSTLHNIRETIKYVRSSEARMTQFKQITSQLKLNDSGLCLDVSTRWNSTYLVGKCFKV